MVELPANGMGWREAIATLELHGMRYVIAVDSLAPVCRGYAIEPQSYRIAGITQRRKLELTLPGVRSALVVMAHRRDRSVTSSRRVLLAEGRLSLDVDSRSGLEEVLLLYPETHSIASLDSWEAMDEHRDAILRCLKTHPPGPGLRGILNPLGNMIHQSADRQFVPNSPRFQAEFAAALEQQYRNVESVKRSWSMAANDLESFADLARLVPLWSGTRGVEMLWDPRTDQLHPVESRRSSIWSDIRALMAQAESKRFLRLVGAMRKVCDVPVVQDWVGWLPAYEQSAPALDGLAARTVGANFVSLAESGGRAASSLLRWSKPGWLIASRIEFQAQEGMGLIPGVSQDLAALGMRGFFFATEDIATRSQIAQEANKRADDPGLAASSPVPLFFPENALNPAHIQPLPGGRWWLPTPEAGNRLDLGTQFTGYRRQTGAGDVYVLWSNSGVRRVRIRVLDPKRLQFQSADGSDPDPSLGRGRLEVTIGPTPLVITGTDEIPIPQPAVDEAGLRFAQLGKEAERFRMDFTEEDFAFRDAFSSFDRNPGGSYGGMMQALHRLNARLARYMWIEGEHFRETSFSEPLAVVGCSAGGVLSLRATLAGAGDDYVAEYAFASRSSEELEVWIAARIPREYRKDVHLVVGSQILRIASEPVSLYGQGFGWYKLGLTRLGGPQSTVQLRVAPQVGAELAVDALLFYPGRFEPKGIRQPDAIAFGPELTSP